MNSVVAKMKLALIENDNESFLHGRRNNDVVNWILLKMYLDQTQGIVKEMNDYVSEWKSLALTKDQESNLADWDRDPVEVIEDCYDRYCDGIIDDIEYLFIQ